MPLEQKNLILKHDKLDTSASTPPVEGLKSVDSNLGVASFSPIDPLSPMDFCNSPTIKRASQTPKLEHQKRQLKRRVKQKQDAVVPLENSCPTGNQSPLPQFFSFPQSISSSPSVSASDSTAPSTTLARGSIIQKQNLLQQQQQLLHQQLDLQPPIPPLQLQQQQQLLQQQLKQQQLMFQQRIMPVVSPVIHMPQKPVIFHSQPIQQEPSLLQTPAVCTKQVTASTSPLPSENAQVSLRCLYFSNWTQCHAVRKSQSCGTKYSSSSVLCRQDSTRLQYSSAQSPFSPRCGLSSQYQQMHQHQQLLLQEQLRQQQQQYEQHQHQALQASNGLPLK